MLVQMKRMTVALIGRVPVVWGWRWVREIFERENLMTSYIGGMREWEALATFQILIYDIIY